ncbi:MAG: DNA recombination protein RmuC, partial [Flavobacterium sp.]|nr:DNA recombination protein RmuC [Flavobacterium sp.]
MISTASLLVVFIVALCLGVYFGKLLYASRGISAKISLESQVKLLQSVQAESKEQLQRLQTEKETIRSERERLAMALSRKESDFDHLQIRQQEQKQEIADLQAKFTKEFENLANRIFDEKSTKFTAQNKVNLDQLLNPLQEKIQNFEKKVEDSHKESLLNNVTLRQEIINLTSLNEKMSQETVNLTKALKGDSKMQGNWGELVLERVLEKSGLEKDREYFVQQAHTDPQGNRVFPDVVIQLPDGKKMIVDSKVSLTAYEKYANEEDSNLKASYLKEHVNSIRRH